MPKILINTTPLLIGFTIAISLYLPTGWWGFWVIFPWIGLSISTGMFIRSFLSGKKRLLGRKVAILMVLPCLLIFVPVINNENFQLEGVALIVMVGFLGKGFIHYAIAKIFGPLIWGRGFCGWAYWTGAVLDWLPIRNNQKGINPMLKNLRYLTLAISLLIPVFMVFVLSYDVRANYINKSEMLWMFFGNVVYYLLAIPLAFIYSDKRFFCKNLCPISLIMIPPSRFSLVKVKPKVEKCIECGACNKICPMGVNVMDYAMNRKPITHQECILCTDCSVVCPVDAI